jgi:MFS family permease
VTARTSDPVAFAGLLLSTTVALVAEGAVNVSLMPYAASLAVPGGGLGLVFATHRLVRIGSAPWAGLAADRWGRRPLVLLGILSSALGLALLAGARGLAALLIARVLYGLASALIITAGTASVFDLAHPSRRGEVLGFYQAALFGVYPLGSAVGGFVVDGLGYERTYLLAGALVLASLAPAAVMMRETRRAVSDPGAARAFVGLGEYVRLLHGPVGRYAALKMLSGFAIWGVIEATFVLFLLARFGPESTWLGVQAGTRTLAGLFVASIMLLGFLLGSSVVGRWADRTGRPLLPVAASFAFLGLALLGLSMATTVGAIAAAVLGVGIAVALATAPLAALVGNAAPPASRAAAMAAYSTLSDLGNSAGAILGATAALAVGYQPTYAATAVLTSAGALVLLAPLARRPAARA